MLDGTSNLPNRPAAAGDIPPPPILDYILNDFANALRSPLGFILVATILASWLVPLLVALFYFSTPASRNQNIFVLNIISILAGIGIAIWTNYLEV